MKTFAVPLIIAGTVILIIGIIFLFADKLPFFNLPGDIKLKKGNVSVNFPVVSCIILSIIISLILNLIAYFINKK